MLIKFCLPEHLTKDEFFFFQTVDVGHTGRLTGVVHTDGGLFTCSTDNSVRLSDPVLEPSTIAQLNSHSAPVARVSSPKPDTAITEYKFSRQIPGIYFWRWPLDLVQISFEIAEILLARTMCKTVFQ